MSVLTYITDNAPFIAFILLLVLIAFGSVWFFKDTLKELRDLAAQHVGAYAIVYVKGGTLILIAVGTSFKEVFQPITAAQASNFAWWDWVIKFSAPIISGLAVLAAFLDRSAATAQVKQKVKDDGPAPAATPPPPASS